MYIKFTLSIVILFHQLSLYSRAFKPNVNKQCLINISAKKHPLVTNNFYRNLNSTTSQISSAFPERKEWFHATKKKKKKKQFYQIIILLQTRSSSMKKIILHPLEIDPNLRKIGKYIRRGVENESVTRFLPAFLFCPDRSFPWWGF